MPEHKHRNSVIRVLVADDHALIRKAVIAATQGEPDIVVVGEARDGEEAVSLALDLQPDVTLMDLVMPKMNGLEATALVCQQWPGAKILALSVASEEEMFFAALRAGAIGYLTKAAEPSDLIAASSPLSPTGVEVAWAFRYCTWDASMPAWRNA